MNQPELTRCFHCGEVVPNGTHFTAEIDGNTERLCCPGCQAVATLIAGSGLTTFYRQRTAYSERPESPREAPADEFSVYDDENLARGFCHDREDGSRDAQLLIGGITCAACTWLIETQLARLDGVIQVRVNLQQQRLDLHFDPAKLDLSEVFQRVSSLGYRPQPYRASALRDQFSAERKQSLRRVAVAGIGMMQVGMFGIALHAGDLQGISAEFQGLLRWVSLLVASFVVWYSARPFFESAWRHLRVGALVMDLPVSLAIGLAWLASVVATLSGHGQVYFDSVVMFTFFLLLGRFLEQQVRMRYGMSWFDLESTLPDSLLRWENEQWRRTVRTELAVGDRVMLLAGDVIGVDARVVSGHSLVREDSFNGEQQPRRVASGDMVYGGTLNVDQNIEATVLCDFAESRLATLQRSVSQAQDAKPRLATLADKISSWFVAAVLLVTLLTALSWWYLDPDRALWVALSVLVISCPCALALATPAALTSATNSLQGFGIIVRGENALESLAATTDLVFDKTGTLTRGELLVGEVHNLGRLSREELLALASGLQQFSNHPVAQAFANIEPVMGLQSATSETGAGIEATHGERSVRMGSLPFCRGLLPEMPEPPDAESYWVAVCDDRGPLGWIGLKDTIREEAPAVIDALRQRGLGIHLLTGDSSDAGPRLAQQLAITSVTASASPEQKMQEVQALQADGAIVTMVGDGLNDAPVLKVANASFAMPGATDLARSQADLVIANGDLWSIIRGLDKAQQCRRTIMQNFAWALSYNACGIPLAVLGFVPPWAAAIGMSLSSLLVVLNSLRLSRDGDGHHDREKRRSPNSLTPINKLAS
ncbi:MAG: heavy metal translocating P-type ATPase [Pseudomonadota bacterium]